MKIAVNVMRKEGAEDNRLPEVLHTWFGPDAGLPGTTFHVCFEPAGSGYVLRPLSSGRGGGSQELASWKRYSCQDIPPLFGLEFTQGAWNQGVVRKGDHTFLFVTLNKGSMSQEHQYSHRFLSPTEFQWQSQNSTRQDSRAGERLSKHDEQGIHTHLFVRQTKMAGSKAAPFIYCSELGFERWEGEKPITIWWQLREPVPESLWQELSVPGSP